MGSSSNWDPLLGAQNEVRHPYKKEPERDLEPL